MVIRLSSHGWCVLIISIFVLTVYYLSSSNRLGHLNGEVISVRKLLIRCIHLAEEAGNIIKTVNTIREPYIYWKSNPHYRQSKFEPLTDADLESHSTILSGLLSTFPNLQVRSEEHTKLSNTRNKNGQSHFHSAFQKSLPNDDLFIPISDLLVWVDPLDASQEFTEGLLEYVAVMVCVALHGRPIIGIIHQPFLNETYWAWQGYAMSSNLHSAIASRIEKEQKMNKTISITLSRSHFNKSAIRQLQKRLIKDQVNFIPAGGSGYKIISLINGNADLYIHQANIRRWDICAVQAVLETSGGHLTGLDGSDFDFGPQSEAEIPSSVGLFGASNKKLHNSWIKKINEILG